MKHNRQEGIKAKKALILLHSYKECDFIELETIYCIAQGDCMESAYDINEEKLLTFKEKMHERNN